MTNAPLVPQPVAAGGGPAGRADGQPLARSPGPGHGRGPVVHEPGRVATANEDAGTSAAGTRPRLAEGIELVGEYEGSGYVEPHYLARRSNGNLIQLTQLLHLVAEACDGNRDLEEIAARVSDGFGRQVSVANVAQLIDGKLMPLGLLADAEGRSPEIAPADPLLGLKARTTLLGGGGVQRAAAVMRPLFWPPVIVTVLLALVVFDIWLFFVHGLAQSLRSTTEQPLVFLLIAALIVVSTALHELGPPRGRCTGVRDRAGWVPTSSWYGRHSTPTSPTPTG